MVIIEVAVASSMLVCHECWNTQKEIRKAINTDILLQYDTVGEGVPRKKSGLSAGNVIVTVFWDEKGTVLVNVLPRWASVNSGLYAW